MASSDTAPARGGVAISLASDTTGAFRSLYIGVAGDVKVDLDDTGTGLVFKAEKGILPVQVAKVYSTANGTTATDIIGLY
jgi:hypothetical protein